MANVFSKFTVYFDGKFWKGIIENEAYGQYEICSITFGPEPSDGEIYELITEKWGLLKFTTSNIPFVKNEKHINPKRMQKIIRRQIMQKDDIGTKAQQALKLQHEQMKTQKKTYSKEQREYEKIRSFEIRRKKQKEKHKGH